MEIRVLNNERGIYATFDGEKYTIISSYYGVVAFSTSIRRNGDYWENKVLNSKNDTEIDFIICDWCGYWDLKSIITRGVKKMESQFVTKKVVINYEVMPGTGNSLPYNWEMKIEKR